MGFWLDVALAVASALLLIWSLYDAVTGKAPSDPPWETWEGWSMVLPVGLALRATDDTLTAPERWGRLLLAAACAVAFAVESIRWRWSKHHPKSIGPQA